MQRGKKGIDPVVKELGAESVRLVRTDPIVKERCRVNR